MRTRHNHVRQGFSLVELLVVISIIVLLVTIALPSISAAMELFRSKSTRTAIGTLDLAIRQYEKDCGQLPDPTGNTRSLVDCLIAAQNEATDGYEGPGFKLMSGPGKVYGPYVRAGEIPTETFSGTQYFLDGYRDPSRILYYVKAKIPAADSLQSNYQSKVPDGGYLLISPGLDGDLTTTEDNITNLSD